MVSNYEIMILPVWPVDTIGAMMRTMCEGGEIMRRTLLLVTLVAIMLLGLPFAAVADGDEVEEVVTEEIVVQEVVIEEVTETDAGLAMAVKAAWGLKLRADPGLSGRVRFVLDCGEQVTVVEGLDEDIVKNGYTWVKVEVTRDEKVTTGYVALKYLTEDLTPNCYWVEAS